MLFKKIFKNFLKNKYVFFKYTYVLVYLRNSKNTYLLAPYIDNGTYVKIRKKIFKSN